MQAPSSCHQDAQPQERDTPWEVFHQRFSQFQYEAAAGPRDAFCKLWELCSQWLKPQTRSVEQILALFVTEKFLQILPADTESSTMLSLETRERLFTLIEGLQRDNGEAENTPTLGFRSQSSSELLETSVSGILSCAVSLRPCGIYQPWREDNPRSLPAHQE